MKKKFNVGLVLALALLIVNVILVVNNQRMIEQLNTQEAEAVSQEEEIKRNIQTIKE